MIKISYELINGYVQGWNRITKDYLALFPYTAEFADIENGKTAEEQLQHFNDNHLNYTIKNGKLYYNKL